MLIASLSAAAAAESGQLDPGYGQGGRSGIDFPQSFQVQLRASARGAISGKTWLFGQDPADPLALYVARLLADGTPDPGFGPTSDGRRRVAVPAALVDHPHGFRMLGASVQPDGKPLVFGGLVPLAGPTGVFPAVVCRLAVAGNFDPAYGTAGCRTLRSFLTTPETCSVTDVAERAPDTLMAIGNCSAPNMQERPFLARLTAAGALDNEFAGGVGMVTPPLPLALSTAQRFHAVAVRPDGLSLVLGEYQWNESGVLRRDLGLWQFDNGGTPHPAFSGDGFLPLVFDAGGDNVEHAVDLALRPDGRALLLAKAVLPTPERSVALLAQVQPDGMLDPEFGSGGMRVDEMAGIAGPYSRISALEIDDLGRGFVAGAVVDGLPAVRPNVGTEFWFGLPISTDEEAGSVVLVSGTEATAGLVQSAHEGLSIPFEVVPGSVTKIVLPASLTPLGPNDTVSARAVHVLAHAPVAVQVHTGGPYTSDSMAALPVQQLGTEYRVQSWGPGIGAGSQLVVAATAPGTTMVTITPSELAAGHPPGVPFQVQVEQGESYLLYASMGDPDLSGTLVQSDRPISLLAGHAAASVPDQTYLYADQAHEQIEPLHRWGTEFVTVPFAARGGGDVITVLAHEAGTVVSVDGAIVAVLGAGETYQVTRDQPTRIEASRPVGVAQFSHSCRFDSLPDEPCFGDPMMTTVPPLAQWSSRKLAVFADDTVHDVPHRRFLNLVVPLAAVGAVALDGVSIPSAQFSAVGDGEHAYAQLERPSAGVELITAPLPVFATVYGFGLAHAYGYPAADAPLPQEQSTADDLVVRYTVAGSRDAAFGDGGVSLLDHAAWHGSMEPTTDYAVRAIPEGDGVLVGSASTDAAAGKSVLLNYRLGNADLFRDGFE